ncbi:MAG: hypothetical protein J5833_08835 [Victivallales bacterium]|nr:hypothetical protein [Victivallales bacterium]
MQQRTRIHAQTLSELNHCVGTARRDAAYNCLQALVMQNDWPSDREDRADRIAKCLVMVNEVLDTTTHSSLMFSDPHQALYDKPLLHFLRLLVQLFQTMELLGDHIRNVMNESDVLSEHLGKSTYSLLQSTCKDFEQHEEMLIEAVRKTFDVGRNLIETNTEHRRQSFNDDDMRRYDKAFAEYTTHYRSLAGI